MADIRFMKKPFIKLLCLSYLMITFMSSCAKSNEFKYDADRDYFLEFQPDIKVIPLKEDLSIGIKMGNENYMLYKPKDYAIDSKLNIYILDSSIESIRKYDSNGTFERYLGKTGQGPGEFLKPEFIKIFNDSLYVFDSTLRKIEMIDLTTYTSKSFKQKLHIDTIFPCGNEEMLIGYFSSAKDKSGEYKRIYYISRFDPKELKETRIYSLHKFTNRIIFQGKRGIGTFTIGDAVVYPWHKNSLDNIYILDFDEENVVVISPEGSVLFSFDFYLDGAGTNINSHQTLEKSEKTPRKMLNICFTPYSLMIDDSDRVWISFLHDSSIKNSKEVTYFNVFSSEGEYLFSAILDKKLYFPPYINKSSLYFIANEREEFPILKRYGLNIDD